MMNIFLSFNICFLAVGLLVNLPGEKEAVGDTLKPAAIIERYIKAVGGMKNINKIKTMMMVMEAEVEGMEIEMSIGRDIERKRLIEQTIINGNVVQKTVVKGNQGYINAMGQSQGLRGDQLEAVKTNLYIIPEIHYEKLGFSLELGEPIEIGGERAHTVVVTTPTGIQSREYFSMKSGLKLGSSSELTGEFEFSDYEEVEDVLFPMTIHVINPQLPFPLESRVVSIEVNGPMDDSLFE
ncbi:MAG: peptidase, M16 family protein [Cyclobacteriaceae bacterium]